MAIDTQDKRRSALSMVLCPLPVADSSISAADRAHAMWQYSGISLSTSVTRMRFAEKDEIDRVIEAYRFALA